MNDLKKLEQKVEDLTKELEYYKDKVSCIEEQTSHIGDSDYYDEWTEDWSSFVYCDINDMCRAAWQKPIEHRVNLAKIIDRESGLFGDNYSYGEA